MARLELPSYLEKFQGWTNYTSDKLFDLFGLARSTYFGWFDDSRNLIPLKDRYLCHRHSKKDLDLEIKLVVDYLNPQITQQKIF